MKIWQRARTLGFSLIEMMLVSGIVAGLLVMGGRYMQTKAEVATLDRASAQIQQVLNAGLSYYVNEGKWPADIAALQTAGYLPAAPVTLKSPFGTPYTIKAIPPAPDTSILLELSVSLPAGYRNSDAIGKILAGKLPFGTSKTTSGVTTITSSVNVPGQNLNNAPSVNYASLYHDGGCVPMPKCPVDQAGNPTSPNIMVAPASVSGMNNAGSANTYPITSFTAFAVTNNDDSPPGCPDSTYAPVCNASGDPAGTKYWRVCLRIITTKGIVQLDDSLPIGATTNTTSDYANITALTRCSIDNEPSGTPF